MPDITMCKGDNCPNKKRCWRFRAPSSFWQSFFEFIPFNFKTDTCEHFWDIKTMGIEEDPKPEEEAGDVNE